MPWRRSSRCGHSSRRAEPADCPSLTTKTASASRFSGRRSRGICKPIRRAPRSDPFRRGPAVRVRVTVHKADADTLLRRRSLRHQREPLTARGVAQALIQADEALTRRLLLAPNQRRRQLQRVSGSKRMPSDQASGTASYVVGGRYGVSVFDYRPKPRERGIEHDTRQRPLAMTTVGRGETLDRRTPPDW